MRLRPPLLGLLLFLSPLSGCRMAEPQPWYHDLPEASDSDLHAIFSLLDDLGVPSPVGRPFVRAYGWADSGNFGSYYGFLLESDGQGFTVLHGIRPVRYAYADRHGFCTPRFVALDLRLEIGPAIRSPTILWPSGTDQPHGTEVRPAPTRRGRPALDLVQVARAAHALGLDAEACKLVAETSSWLLTRGPDLVPRIRTEVADALLEEAIRAYRCSQRPVLRERFQLISRVLPNTPAGEGARAQVAALDRLLAEDAEHELVSYEALRRLPVQAQIDDLVLRLRDQRTVPVRGPASWPTSWSPAGLLIAIGRKAIPALMRLSDDDRSTRVVVPGLPYPRVLTYSDVALQIVSAIAPAPFRDWPAAERWWRLLREGGVVEAAATMFQEASSAEARSWANTLWGQDRLAAVSVFRRVYDSVPVEHRTLILWDLFAAPREGAVAAHADAALLDALGDEAQTDWLLCLDHVKLDEPRLGYMAHVILALRWGLPVPEADFDDPLERADAIAFLREEWIRRYGSAALDATRDR